MLRLNSILFILLPVLGWGHVDNTIENRLNSIQKDIPLTYNSYVSEYINAFIRNEKNYTSSSLARFFYDEKQIEEIIKSYDLPTELKYLAYSLSGCSNFEVSEEGGTGYYLMRYAVAKNKGLHISSYVDERRDFVKATHALCKEISELYRKYNDWHKAICAYFSSSLELDRAVSYSKDSLKLYWNAHLYLPARYQRTVSKYIASVYIANFYGEHGIKVDRLTFPDTDTVRVTKLTTLKHISTRIDVDYELVKTLNPTYKREIIPNSGRPYYLRLPVASIDTFLALGDSVYLTESQMKDTVEQPKVAAIPQPEYTAVYYTVRSGDMLLYIADYYDTRVSNIKRWNGLSSDRINVGQKLKIMVPTKKLDYYSKINGMSRTEKRRIANKD